MTLSKKITFNNYELQIHIDGFYEIIVHEEFNIEDLKKLVSAQIELGAEKLPVLILCSQHASTDSDLLKTLSKNSNNPYSKADAFVIKSMAQKILANFYIKISKPERPTKFFSNKDDALIWIKQYL